MKIIVIGTVFVDIKGRPFSRFIPDGRNAGTIETVHGGVGRNIAEDLANLGADVTLLSLVEPGGIGDEVVAHLDAAGVRTGFMRRAESGSGTWLAVFDENGDVVSSISVRPCLLPLCEVLDAHHEEIFAGADAVLVEIDIDTPVVDRVFRYAGQYGKKVYCAVATMSHALDKGGYLRKAELFICNGQEAGMLFEDENMPWNAWDGNTPAELPDGGNDTASVLRKKTAEYGLRRMIVTLAAAGSVYAEADGVCGSCPPQKVVPVDSTGAGDSYCAGTVLALTAGLPLSAACAIGTRIAASVVASPKNVYDGPALTF